MLRLRIILNFLAGMIVLLLIASLFYVFRSSKDEVEKSNGNSEKIPKPIDKVESQLALENLQLGSDSLSLNIVDDFNISLFGQDLTDARVMRFDPGGVLLVSLTSEGQIAALPDRNNDGKADEKKIILSRLNDPHGIELSCSGEDCKLYIAETNALSVFDYNPQALTASNKKKIADLPGGGRHSTRTIEFLPGSNEEKLLVHVGSSCDVCQENDERRAAILLVDINSGEVQTFASGLRNSVFMAVNPRTNEVWATEMGRDYLGDDLPPEEVNIIKQGSFYGWPYCYGNKVLDSSFDSSVRAGNMCQNSVPAHIEIPAHSAPLGLAFVPDSWEGYQNSLLVAYHGSWNRSSPTGYKIVIFRLDENGNVGESEDFITGWLTENGEVLGRPVHLVFDSQGKLYISDDKAGVIYLVERK